MPYDHRKKEFKPDPASTASTRDLEDIRARFSRLNPARDRKAEGKKLAADRDAVSAAAADELLDRDLNGWAEEHPGRKHRDRILQGRGLADVEWVAHRESNGSVTSDAVSPAVAALAEFSKSETEKARERTEMPAWVDYGTGE